VTQRHAYLNARGCSSGTGKIAFQILPITNYFHIKLLYWRTDPARRLFKSE
jgi:hypothetical protein